MVPEPGIEPGWGCPRGILSPLRLPISPLRHAYRLHNICTNSIDGKIKITPLLLLLLVKYCRIESKDTIDQGRPMKTMRYSIS